MTDSLASNLSTRVQLETHFDEYLGTIVDYLRQEYSELRLPQELIDEVAATVIVRVSHASPEPVSLEQALYEAADEVVASRRPQLSRASLSGGEVSIFGSEFPASVPSLRLIQRSKQEPHSQPNIEASDALDSGRLSLPDPPQDLRAALGLGLEPHDGEQAPAIVKHLDQERLNTQLQEPTANVELKPESEAKAQAEVKPKQEPKPRRKPARRQEDKPRAKARKRPAVKAAAPWADDVTGLSLAVGPAGVHALPDEIAMLSMTGFPNNAKRAARLCVVALAEEIGVEPSVDLSSQIDRVTEALERLASALTDAAHDPRHAAMEWQRTARKATLQAFFCDRF